MYNLVFDSGTSDNLYYSIGDFIEQKINVRKIGISKKQLMHLHDILDTKKNYNTLDQLYKKFNIDETIKKDKLNNAIFLLLVWNKNIIYF